MGSGEINHDKGQIANEYSGKEPDCPEEFFKKNFPELQFFPLDKAMVNRFKGETLPAAKMYMNDGELELEFIDRRALNPATEEYFIRLPIIDLMKYCISKKRLEEIINRFIRQMDGAMGIAEKKKDVETHKFANIRKRGFIELKEELLR